MKGKVLQALREEGDHVSGEALARQLGTSRTSISQHVRSLRRHGYVIESSRIAYRLVYSPDLLLPYEFPDLEHRIHHFMEIGSTMDPARDLAREGAERGTIVIAELQNYGRGRLSREWVSPKGGIYFTVILRPQITPAYAPLANLMTSVVVATSIRKLYGLEASVKWPNDVLIDGRKVCGILAEMESDMNEVKFINVGIGINANTAVPQFGDTATSLKQALARDVCRQELLRSLLCEIDLRQDTLMRADSIEEWRDLSVTLGSNVRIAAGREVIAGTAIDVDGTGSLIVRERDGSLRKVVAGDCSQ